MPMVTPKYLVKVPRASYRRDRTDRARCYSLYLLYVDDPKMTVQFCEIELDTGATSHKTIKNEESPIPSQSPISCGFSLLLESSIFCSPRWSPSDIHQGAWRWMECVRTAMSPSTEDHRTHSTDISCTPVGTERCG